MENIILVIHMILALCLILVVLLQRSEGGGLGIGGGGGGVMSGRSAAGALTKLTWMLATAFIVTSVSLTVIAANNSQADSVIERQGTGAGDAPAGTTPTGLGGDLLPPSADDAPITPPSAD